MSIVYIGLGSNLKNPLWQVQTAFKELAELPKTTVTKESKLYQTKPVGFTEQPDFINAVAELKTQLLPLHLLAELQQLEQKHQRVRTKEHNGPRTLDLDILLYGDYVINTEILSVPHPRLKTRAFVLRPLMDVAPKLQLPSGELLSEIPCDEITPLLN